MSQRHQAGALDPRPAGQPGPEVGVALGVGGVERQCRHRSGVDVRRARLHHAERVALDVAEHHPRHVALADVDVAGAEPEQPLDHLGLTVVAVQVEVEPLRLGRRLRDLLEAQVEHRAAVDGEPGLEHVRLVGELLAAERRLPEAAQTCGSTASKTRFSRYMPPA